MTAATRPEPAKPCPVCDGDEIAAFAVSPWGFHPTAIAGCPLCQPDAVWRRVLAPFLEAEPA